MKRAKVSLPPADVAAMAAAGGNGNDKPPG
jgi:hypothetical protein